MCAVQTSKPPCTESSSRVHCALGYQEPFFVAKREGRNEFLRGFNNRLESDRDDNSMNGILAGMPFTNREMEFRRIVIVLVFDSEACEAQEPTFALLQIGGWKISETPTTNPKG